MSKFSSPKELLFFREEHERVLSFFFFVLFETESLSVYSWLSWNLGHTEILLSLPPDC